MGTEGGRKKEIWCIVGMHMHFFFFVCVHPVSPDGKAGPHDTTNGLTVSKRMKSQSQRLINQELQTGRNKVVCSGEERRVENKINTL